MGPEHSAPEPALSEVEGFARVAGVPSTRRFGVLGWWSALTWVRVGRALTWAQAGERPRRPGARFWVAQRFQRCDPCPSLDYGSAAEVVTSGAPGSRVFVAPELGCKAGAPDVATRQNLASRKPLQLAIRPCDLHHRLYTRISIIIVVFLDPEGETGAAERKGCNGSDRQHSVESA